MRFAIINQANIVVNVGLADSPMGEDWIASDTAGPGWTYANGVFTPPEPVTPPPVRELQKVEYLKRFTQEERIAIRTSAKVNAVAEDYIELMNAATVVHLDDPDTIKGVNTLEAAGLLAPGRAAQILA